MPRSVWEVERKTEGGVQTFERWEFKKASGKENKTSEFSTWNRCSRNYMGCSKQERILCYRIVWCGWSCTWRLGNSGLPVKYQKQINPWESQRLLYQNKGDHQEQSMLINGHTVISELHCMTGYLLHLSEVCYGDQNVLSVTSYWFERRQSYGSAFTRSILGALLQIISSII